MFVLPFEMFAPPLFFFIRLRLFFGRRRTLPTVAFASRGCKVVLQFPFPSPPVRRVMSVDVGVVRR